MCAYEEKYELIKLQNKYIYIYKNLELICFEYFTECLAGEPPVNK